MDMCHNLKHKVEFLYHVSNTLFEILNISLNMLHHLCFVRFESLTSLMFILIFCSFNFFLILLNVFPDNVFKAAHEAEICNRNKY
jgi:hypothetical protein